MPIRIKLLLQCPAFSIPHRFKTIMKMGFVQLATWLVVKSDVCGLCAAEGGGVQTPS